MVGGECGMVGGNGGMVGMTVRWWKGVVCCVVEQCGLHVHPDHPTLLTTTPPPGCLPSTPPAGSARPRIQTQSEPH